MPRGTLNTDNPSFYAKDANLVFFDVMPFKYNGWAEYKKAFRRPSLIKYQEAD
jgi:hypothetical protein